jgi:hypothetical protein
MYPRPSTVSLKLTAQQAETIFWELLGLLDHYRSLGPSLEASDESALLSAITQLELGIKRAETVAEVQLENLRVVARKAKEQA